MVDDNNTNIMTNDSINTAHEGLCRMRSAVQPSCLNAKRLGNAMEAITQLRERAEKAEADLLDSSIALDHAVHRLAASRTQLDAAREAIRIYLEVDGADRTWQERTPSYNRLYHTLAFIDENRGMKNEN